MNRKERRAYIKRNKNKGADSATIYIDSIRQLIESTILNHPKEELEARAFAISIFEREFPRIEKFTKIGIVPYEEAQDYLKAIFDSLEREAEKIISKHSNIFWNMLDSRVSLNESFSENKVSTLLYRETLRYLIYKYSNSKSNDVFFSNNRVIPKGLTSNVVLDYIKLKNIACELYLVTTDLRKIWKGCQFYFIKNNSGYTIKGEDSISKAITFMDSRTSKNSNILGMSGTYLSSQLLENHLQKNIYLLYAHPVSGYNYTMKYKGNVINQVCNYELRPINLDYLRTVIKPLNNNFLKKYDISSDDFVNFLIVLSERVLVSLISKSNNENQYVKGYLSYKENVFLEELFFVWKNNIIEKTMFFGLKNDDEIKAIVNKIYNILLIEEENQKDIDVYNRINAKMFYKSVLDNCVVDYRFVISVIDEMICNSLPVSEVSGNIFRDESSDLILDFLTSNNSLVKPYKKTNYEFSFNGKKRECDISFTVGEYLFVCEVKARRMSEEKRAGFFKTVRNNWEDSLKDLNQVRTLSEFISENKNEFKIPNTIKFLVPLVIYPLAGWIPTLESPYLISNSVPRFLTPEELLSSLKDLTKFKDDNLTLKINE